MEVSEILKKYKAGELSLGAAKKAFRETLCLDVGCAKIDIDRMRRTGVQEVVFGEGKTPQQICLIAEKLVEKFSAALVTRIAPAAFAELSKIFPDAKYFPLAKLAYVDRRGKKTSAKSALKKKNFIAVVCAGTADLPVAEEAVRTAEFLGSRAVLFADCGVAGLHRLLDHIDRISKAKVVIAVAGMEGALASVLAGLVKVPLIAVPTSVGYGASFEGVTALLAMINSCANGVSVVNIDNGYGAAYNAHLINSI